MDTNNKSILLQKAAGTYDRNQYIRHLHSQGKSCAEIGREFNLSRQAVLAICRQPGK